MEFGVIADFASVRRRRTSETASFLISETVAHDLKTVISLRLSVRGASENCD